jgi:hypothetical protein
MNIKGVANSQIRSRSGMFVFALAFIVAGLIIVGFLLSPADQTYGVSFGKSGCCMKRGCPDDICAWYVVPGSLDHCDELNDRLDGDNVYSNSGLIWWDISC